MIACAIVQNVCVYGDHQPPHWPPFFAGSWELLEMAALRNEPSDAELLQRFGGFRDQVTKAEFVAAAEVCTLLRAWREMLDLADPEDDYTSLCSSLRHHLRAAWDIKIGKPPTLAHAHAAATRLTRRYDLLPRHVREVMPS